MVQRIYVIALKWTKNSEHLRQAFLFSSNQKAQVKKIFSRPRHCLCILLSEGIDDLLLSTSMKKYLYKALHGLGWGMGGATVGVVV